VSTSSRDVERRDERIAAVLVIVGTIAALTVYFRFVFPSVGQEIAKAVRGQALMFPVPPGAGVEGIASSGGLVWYAARRAGALGRLNPRTGSTQQIILRPGSMPDVVAVGDNGILWVGDSGLNAILQIDPGTMQVQRRYPLPARAKSKRFFRMTFARGGMLWFTLERGLYGRLDVASRRVDVFVAPEGGEPYGLAVTADGIVYFASLSQGYIARVAPETGTATVIRSPTRWQGRGDIAADLFGRVWVTMSDAASVGVYDPDARGWKVRRVAGGGFVVPESLFVQVDGVVWFSDFGALPLWTFHPAQERFTPVLLPAGVSRVLNLVGDAGGIWGVSSTGDALVRFEPVRP